MADATAAVTWRRTSRIDQRRFWRFQRDRLISAFVVRDHRFEYCLGSEGGVSIGIVVATINTLVDLRRSAGEIIFHAVAADGQFKPDHQWLIKTVHHAFVGVDPIRYHADRCAHRLFRAR